LAFFHASGYRPLLATGHSEPIVEANQALAQLHYAFAAHDGDKGAQMAMGYRFWTGIGAQEDCGTALEWYDAASNKGKTN
jgi:SEL1 protein